MRATDPLLVQLAASFDATVGEASIAATAFLFGAPPVFWVAAIVLLVLGWWFASALRRHSSAGAHH